MKTDFEIRMEKSREMLASCDRIIEDNKTILNRLHNTLNKN